ncbi:hypothetical protein [Parabacteroides sp. AM08-6]|uniref:hypothetical protein n=1 Tax=Parabacteroides sp. AM08-6 TaxID=2292053 RepID=UPI000F00D4B4|nr:hypothetical protein [Parabacteroides sp. AM08-6]RHJ82539.1 hypothetical protein DW103_09315 [Parabacteroides sp. AM08-6]
MKKQYTYKPVVLRFKRWSRKKYAAFISIKQAVTIGNLSANVSERFQIKNGSTHARVLLSEQGEKDECEEEAKPDNWLNTDIPHPLLSASWLIPTVQQPVVAAHLYIYKNNISEKAEGFSIMLSPSAFSF